jgi:hypothetical protein
MKTGVKMNVLQRKSIKREEVGRNMNLRLQILLGLVSNMSVTMG